MTSWQAGPYRIEKATGRRLEQALAYCCGAYRRKGYMGEHSKGYPDRFYAISRDGELRGTIGLYMPGGDRRQFPTEAVFGYSLARAGIDPRVAAEVGRFSGEGQLFVPVISWLTLHMHEDLGLAYAIFGAKPRIRRALNRMGVPTVVHSVGEPDLEAVPRAFWPYFQSSPQPIVMTARISAAVGVARDVLARLAEPVALE